MRPSLVIEACVDHEQLHASSQLQASCKFSLCQNTTCASEARAYHEAWYHDLCIKLPRVLHFSHRHGSNVAPNAFVISCLEEYYMHLGGNKQQLAENLLLTAVQFTGIH